jgi:hypothetical protein
MEVRALITQLLEMPMDAQVFAVDQFGVAECEITDVRDDSRCGRVLLDMEVPDEEDEESDEERAETRPVEVAEF